MVFCKATAADTEWHEFGLFKQGITADMLFRPELYTFKNIFNFAIDPSKFALTVERRSYLDKKVVGQFLIGKRAGAANGYHLAK